MSNNTSTVIDKNGVELAGPEGRGLQEAEAREGTAVVVNEERGARLIGGAGAGAGAGNAGGLIGASVGHVSDRQATGRIQVTEAMVNRAQAVDPALDPALVRAMLVAALQP